MQRILSNYIAIFDMGMVWLWRCGGWTVGCWWMCAWRSGSWGFGAGSCFILVVMYVKVGCEVLVMAWVSLWRLWWGALLGSDVAELLAGLTGGVKSSVWGVGREDVCLESPCLQCS